MKLRLFSMREFTNRRKRIFELNIYQLKKLPFKNYICSAESEQRRILFQNYGRRRLAGWGIYFSTNGDCVQWRVQVFQTGREGGGGGNFQGGGTKLLFGQFFPKNCIKMKEFGPRGGGASLVYPFDPPMVSLLHHHPAGSSINAAICEEISKFCVQY